MGRLDGKVALVTGGARGMGEAHVRQLLADGARVVFGDLRDELGGKLAAELGDERCRYVHHDVTSPEDWARAVESTVSAFGRLDVLVNNAGILLFAPVERMPLADFRRVLDVNVTGSWLGIQQVTPVMRDGGGGSIVNISSVEGFAGAAGLSAYSASKFAIRGITRSAAQELGRDRIRVNSVHPGGILTPLVRDAMVAAAKAARAAEAAGAAGDQGGAARAEGPGGDVLGAGAGSFVARMPIPRLGDPAEVARVVAFLASDESSYCTGSEFVVDGGMISGPGY